LGGDARNRGRRRAGEETERHAALTEVATRGVLPHAIAVEFFSYECFATDEDRLPGAKCGPGKGEVAHAEALGIVDTPEAEIRGTRLQRTPLELLSIDADVEAARVDCKDLHDTECLVVRDD
jgi:hypothetical protein